MSWFAKLLLFVASIVLGVVARTLIDANFQSIEHLALVVYGISGVLLWEALK